MRYWGDGGWGEDVEHSGDWVHGDGGIVVMEVEWWVGCCDGGWGRDDGERGSVQW